MRCLGFGGGIEPGGGGNGALRAVGRGATVGETGEVCCLGAIGGGVDDCGDAAGVNGVFGGP
jgi:hypothetical protein